MKKLFLILTATCLIYPLFSQENDSISSSLMWEITGKKVKSPSYIFGTMHLIPEKDFYFPESIQEKIKNSDLLVMEIGGIQDNVMSSNNDIMKMMMLDTGTVWDYFTEPQLDSIYTFAEKELDYTKEQLQMFSKMKPFALIQIFTQQQFGETPKSYELEIEKIAKENEVEIDGLETVFDQIKIISSPSPEEQAKMVMQTIKMGAEENGAQEIVEMYLTQDIDSIYQLTTAGNSGGSEFEEVFVTQRNKNWVQPIQKFVKRKKTFIAVGAAHLGGPNGVIQLLKEKGYTLTPVKF